MCVCPVVASGIANISQTFRKKKIYRDKTESSSNIWARVSYKLAVSNNWHTSKIAKVAKERPK